MNIKKKTTVSLMVIVAVFAIAAVMTVLPGAYQASAHDGPHEGDDDTHKNVAYVYTTQPSDSYTLMARKAIQTYGKKYNVNLSQAQILFAETNLTLEAGSPQLNEGQSVTISEATVKNWVEKAKALSANAVAAWNLYVPGVNFNTDKVGQR